MGYKAIKKINIKQSYRKVKKITKTVLVIYFLFLGKVYIVQILFPDGSSKYAK